MDNNNQAFVKPTSHDRLWRIAALVLLLSTTLAGCSKQHADSLFRDYQQRLDRVLTLPPMAVTLTALPPLPAIRDVQVSIPASRLNLLDLVALRHCGLQQLVAERNNSLGKVMSSANLLGYELQLLAALQPCLHHPALSTKLNSELLQIYQQKQQQLPVVLHNFLSTDLTLRQQLSGQARLLSAGASHAVAEPLAALKQLNRLKQQLLAGLQTDDAPLTASFINQQLAVLYQGNLIADWHFSVRQSNAWLTTLNAQLAQVPVASLCRSPAKIAVLNNVLTQIFIPRVQSYLAELDRIGYQLLPELSLLYQHNALETSVEVRLTMPAQQLRDLIKQHVGWYQQLQRQCQVKLLKHAD